MGRIVDLCGEIAAAADEGPEGLVLPPEAWDRLREDWPDEDIEDCLGFVRDSLLQGELVEAADNLSSRLLEILGEFGEAGAFGAAAAGEGRLSIELLDQLARRVSRLEDVLSLYRDTKAPDRRGLDALQRRLADHGIEAEMGGDEPDDDE